MTQCALPAGSVWAAPVLVSAGPEPAVTHASARTPCRRFLSIPGVLLEIFGVSGGASALLNAADPGEREEAITFSKKWIDVAAVIGSPSIRTNIPSTKDGEPDLNRASDRLLRVVEYAASRNIVIHLENDNPVSEDHFPWWR